MKIHLIKSLATLSFCSGLMLMGCLKDKAYDERTIQSNHGDSPKVIEIGLTGTSNRNFATKSLDASSNDTTLTLFPVQLAANEPAQEDINVTVTGSATAVTAYNATQSAVTGFVPYVPSTSTQYSIVNTGGIVTIPKGSYSGLLSIKFKSNNFLGANYAIGFTISSVDKPGYLISGNLQNAVVGIAVKNQYDGVYNIRGYHTRGGDPTLTGPTGTFQRSLVTSGPASITWTGTVPWGMGGAVSNLPDMYQPIITVIAGNKLALTSANGLISIDPAYNNRYDPATKTFYMRWTYPSGAERSFVDTLVYLKPR